MFLDDRGAAVNRDFGIRCLDDRDTVERRHLWNLRPDEEEIRVAVGIVLSHCGVRLAHNPFDREIGGFPSIRIRWIRIIC